MICSRLVNGSRIRNLPRKLKANLNLSVVQKAKEQKGRGKIQGNCRRALNGTEPSKQRDGKRPGMMSPGTRANPTILEMINQKVVNQKVNLTSDPFLLGTGLKARDHGMNLSIRKKMLVGHLADPHIANTMILGTPAATNCKNLISMTQISVHQVDCSIVRK